MTIEIGQAQDTTSLGAFALPSVPTHDQYKVSQEDIPAGKTAGVLFEFYVLNTGRVFSQRVYDGVFRPAFAELGYELSDSVMASEPMMVAWEKYGGEQLDMEGNPLPPESRGDQWVLVVKSGPRRLVGESFATTTRDPLFDPTEVRAAAARSAAVYRVLLRPRDQILTLAKVKTLTRKVTELSRSLGENAEQRARSAFVVKGVNPIPTHPALWLSLIGLGAVGIISATRKKK